MERIKPVVPTHEGVLPPRPENSREDRGAKPVTDEDFLKAIGVPVRFHRAQIIDFSEGVPGMTDEGIFITGLSGVGKSHMMAAIVTTIISIYCDVLIAGSYNQGKTREEAIEDGSYSILEQTVGRCGIRWINVPELLEEIKNGFRKDKQDRLDLKELASCEVLVLDDLGAEKTTDWTASTLYVLINKRIDNLKTTLITSNISLEGFEDRDPRLASRLSSLRYHLLEGEDRRDSFAKS